MRRFVMAVGVLALVVSSCASTEEQFKDSLIDQGFTESEAQCVIDELEAAGIDPADVTDEALGDDPPPAEAIAATIECVAIP